MYSEGIATMMDNFREEIIVRKQGKVVNALGYIVCWFFIILFGLFGMIGLTGIMGMDFTLANFIALLVGGGAAFLLWRFKDNFRIEYEYSFTNGEMDFAMVLGNNRRKNLTSVRMREVEAAADFFPAEKHYGNKSRLHKERDDAFDCKRCAENVADKPAVV